MERYRQFVAFEHYRMHVIELWPEGAAKQAALRSVQSALAGLLMPGASGTVPFECVECRLRLVSFGHLVRSAAAIDAGLRAA